MKALRIGVLGAGPAGLYAAVLLKKENPAHEITVIERNPEGATFGFGVVMSDKTMTHFRDADSKTFDEITAHQATWGAIETVHRGVPVRCEGHTYSGISRKRLLDILQRRCEELGVSVQYEREVADLSVFAGYDLILAADGVNSTVRRLYPDKFEATLEPGKSKFIWLGVDQWVPSAFTFVFIETEHGVFQAHMYPFDKDKSTCIVMCRDATWKRAGLDQLDEAGSVAFVSELMRPYLGDAKYLTNRSLWGTFNTVKTKHWSHGNIVMLGDAMHTAHWSIGSGTKLAMEDAIALVDALKRYEDIPTALATYEVERRPIVEKIQRAAKISELNCEDAERYMHLDPVQFAFQLLTRSNRLDYENLKLRDAEYIAGIDRWAAERAKAEFPGFDRDAISPCLAPTKVGNLTLENRVVVAAAPVNAATDGLPDAASLDAIRNLAKGAAALVQTDVVAVSAAGRSNPGAAGLYTAAHKEAWQRLVADVHAGSTTKVALQLGHAGGEGADQIKAAFTQAAQMAAEAGFDLLQLNLGHSVPQDLFAAVRAVWPAEKPLAVSLWVTANGEGGLSVPEATTVAHLLRENGCDLVEVKLGGAGIASTLSDQVRNDARVRTMVRAATSTEANTMVAAARADLCVMDPAAVSVK